MGAFRVCPGCVPMPCPTARPMGSVWLHRQLLCSLLPSHTPFLLRRGARLHLLLPQGVELYHYVPLCGSVEQLVQFTQ